MSQICQLRGSGLRNSPSRVSHHLTFQGFAERRMVALWLTQSAAALTNKAQAQCLHRRTHLIQQRWHIDSFLSLQERQSLLRWLLNIKQPNLRNQLSINSKTIFRRAVNPVANKVPLVRASQQSSKVEQVFVRKYSCNRFAPGFAHTDAERLEISIVTGT